MARTLKLDVWSDIVCPFCYIGKRKLERALGAFAHAADVEVRYRAFELDPSAPRVLPASGYAARLATKYGTTVAQAEGMIARVVSSMAAEGIAMNTAVITSGNTFDAHRLIALARAHGLEAMLVERLMRGYFCEGAAIGERDTLLRLACEAGLGADEVVGALDTDLYAEETRADQRAARELGISGVPFYLFAGRYAVSGAQPVEMFEAALTRAYAELPEPEVAAGPTCGPEGCAE
jgi:predicted DsbA family dithiol-disulfide isomerase